jgi:hypothetical protein
MHTHFYPQQGLFCHVGGLIIFGLELFYAEMLSFAVVDEKRNVHRKVAAAKEVQQNGARPCACVR